MPQGVFDADKWQKALTPELWKKVVYLLNRGGRFEDFEKAFDGEQLKNKYGKQINIYIEKLVKIKIQLPEKVFFPRPRIYPLLIPRVRL